MRTYLTTLLFLCNFLTFLEGSTQHKHGPLFLIDELHSWCPTDNDFYHRIAKDQLITIFLSANEGAKIAQDLVGITECFFYSISPSLKLETQNVYNENSEEQILLINKNIKLLHGKTKKSANFISHTLTKMVSAVNKLIIDSSENASQTIINEDYMQIQAVVDAFKAGFPKVLHFHERRGLVCRAILLADVSLQNFATTIENYVSQLNLIVFQNSLGNPELLSSNFQLVLSLRKFVEASAIATYLETTRLRVPSHH